MRQDGKISLGVYCSSLLFLIVPIAFNVMRLRDADGSRMPAVGVLFLIIFLNLFLMPGLSASEQRRVYATTLAKIFDVRILAFLCIYLLVAAVATLRGIGYFYTIKGALAMVVILFGTVLAYASSLVRVRNDSERNLLILSVLFSLPFFVLANIVMYVAGAASAPVLADVRPNSLLGLVGVSMGRAFFPLAYGTNTFGAIAAVSMVICALMVWCGRTWVVKGAAFLFFLSSSVGAVLTDSRAGIVFAAMAIFWCVLLGRGKVLAPVMLGTVVLSIFVPFAGYELMHVANQHGWGGGLIREGTQGASLGVGTGREAIWGGVIDQLKNFEVEQVIGYGAYGHFTSGASAAYSWVFNEFGSTASASHNTFLQNVLDNGYVGAALWITLLWKVVHLLMIDIKDGGEDYSRYRLVGVGLVLFLLMQSQTETYATLYQLESLFLLIGLVVVLSFFAGGGAGHKGWIPVVRRV